MSELKARTARSIANEEEMLEMGSGESIEQMLVYPKSEADKVIARHKYKRCLAMAEWCKRKRIDAADYRIPRGKWDFYDKWHKRWLELAEKFKDKEAK